MTWVQELTRAVRIDRSDVYWLDAPLDARTTERLAGHVYKCFYCPGRPVTPDRATDLLVGVSSEFEETCARAFGSFALVGAGVNAETPIAGVRWVSDGNHHRLRARAARLSPGFFLFGHDGLLMPGDAPVLRLYLNLTPAGVVSLLRSLGKLRSAAFHSAKVLRSPISATRADVAVVYLRCVAVREVHKVVAGCLVATRGLRRPHTPAMTLKIDAGAGFAVGPTDGQSFGMHRSQLVAQAIHAALHEPAASLDELVSQSFETAGLDVTRPYWVGSCDRFVPSDRPAARPRRPTAIASHAVLRGMRHGSLVLGGQRTWFSSIDGVTRSVDASLYSGHAGIALALAAAAHYGHDGAREDAQSAASQALRLATHLPYDGLQQGRAGVLGAIALVSKLLGQPVVAADDWERLAADFVENYVPSSAAGVDLFHGPAGTVIALQPAVRQCERLRTSFDRAALRVLESSRLLNVESARPGLAHGVAGLQAALSVVAAMSTHPIDSGLQVRLAVMEDRWFDAARQDWAHADATLAPHFLGGVSRAWCHGRQGILLSRLAAGAPLPDSWKPTQLSAGDDWTDGSLCHGVSGSVAYELLLGTANHDRCREPLADAHRTLTPQPGWWPAPGLLDGRAGVLLATLALDHGAHAISALAWALAVPGIVPPGDIQWTVDLQPAQGVSK